VCLHKHVKTNKTPKSTNIAVQKFHKFHSTVQKFAAINENRRKFVRFIVPLHKKAPTHLSPLKKQAHRDVSSGEQSNA
jgi:hypothetical protein